MGKNEQWIIALAIEEGRPLPRSIAEAPVLDEITHDYYRAFGDLSRMRGFTSNGVSLPLTFEALDRYATRFDFDDFEDFFQIISDVDESYLKLESKRRSAEDRRQKQKYNAAERKKRTGN